ncbi:MAG TPA: bifunctional proline dehydrogenase/L-glutamate gamma-semialdehyde dehydrogenase PutA [Rhodanobacteraceae bacterium]|nr:bifunctional proline dehydrogenase/L-glutamate gamma-semialdehyde dehydrogenase PutA [Rhodanobacteraceae bacterium]
MAEILSPELPDAPDAARARITGAWLRDETEAVLDMLDRASLPPDARDAIEATAADLVKRVRAKQDQRSAIAAFMQQYDLSSSEGILLMCIAEALLRIPDSDTADKLIRDKLAEADWKKHLGTSKSVFVNASTWGLLLTGHLVRLPDATRRDYQAALRRLVNRAGEPLVRMAVRQAMRIMGQQFIMGSNINAALLRAQRNGNDAYRYSFDMLGEAALTQTAADMYMQAYRNAVEALGNHPKAGDVLEAPSISVKLSALHPRYEVAKRARVMDELVPRVLELSQQAMARGIALTIDAEEAARLELSLDILHAVFAHPSLQGWNGFGLAVQAYQKRAPFVIDWLAETARATGRRWCVRLVKGAYWDAEIKLAQEQGLAGYPVYTRKPSTDVSYLACARRMFDAGAALIYPQFATHNAHTIAAIHRMARGRPFEFQRLHGMGKELYDEVIGKAHMDVPCRVYAPVGSHKDLLPYLVRRLLENGANTSFINHVVDEFLPMEQLVGDPCEAVRAFESKPHPRIPLPVNLYGHLRKNSMGVNLADDDELKALAQAINATRGPWRAEPLVPGARSADAPRDITSPADRRVVVGQSRNADAATILHALDNAIAAQPAWDDTPADERAKILERAADLLEENRAELIALCVREAGKTIPAAIGEVREAADMCRYYAARARELFGKPENLPGPTGETNRLYLHGRGVFVCISPWNFPLAIFTGQVAAGLAAGNSVIAKPAEPTTLIGHFAVKLLHQAGVPEQVLQYVPCRGRVLGETLLTRPEVSGVCFTGSTETAWTINRTLAARSAPIAALIAETGGQNALIADSSALPEQLVKDVMTSAFDSAGQRCSAARVLFVQEDIADHVIRMLQGAMDELTVGDPALLSTDVGPVIDQPSCASLEEHAEVMRGSARLINMAKLPEGAEHGTFFAPRAYEIPSIKLLTREVFGPALHVVRWKAGELDAVIDAINATGFGLTLGIHSRIDATVEHIRRRARVGNTYVNRNQIGAVVGVQPFGGENLSGTGPKAGGPHYLLRFATERTFTVNTTAAGGNASLLTLQD